MLESCLQDIRYGARMLAKSPGFTAVAALSLALGIGANTAIFTLVNAALLKLLPVRDPEQLVLLKWVSRDWPEPMVKSLWGSSRRDEGRMSSTSFSYPSFESLRARNQAFSGIFAFADLGRVSVTVDGQAGLAESQLVSAEAFPCLGVSAAVGRVFTSEDDSEAAAPTAVLGYGYWQRRFGGNAAAIGKPIAINGIPFTVVGVAPPRFAGLSPGTLEDVWIPIRFLERVSPRQTEDGSPFARRDFWWVWMMGRLKPDVSAEAAQAGLDILFKQSVLEGVTLPKDKPPDVPALQLGAGGQGLDFLRRQMRQPLLILTAVVGLVLLIAWANVANLLLARAAVRQREIAVRLSLGTTRGRLVRQLLTESVLLASLGAALGLLLAHWGSRLLLSLATRGDRVVALDLTLDPRVLGFTMTAGLLTAVLFGLAPALRATRVDPFSALRESSGGTPGGRLRLGLAKTLVVSQVALSLVLLVGAALFVRTLSNLKSLDVGFDRDSLLLFGIDATQAGYAENRLVDLYERVQRSVETLPGVRSATMSPHLLLSGSSRSSLVAVPGYTPPGKERPVVNVLLVGPRFFETMRLPLLLGRGIEATDDEAAPKIAVANQAMIRRFWGQDPPLGKRFDWGRNAAGNGIEIVGVAKDARYDRLRGDPPPTVYLPVRQSIGNFGAMHFEVRTTLDPKSLIPAVRRAVAALDPGLPLYDVKTQREQIDELLVQERLFARLIGFFGVLALGLVCVGLYGILSFAVARRRGEIGVRMALGARRGHILSMVLREALLLVGAGVAAGMLAAFATARGAASVISGLLFGIEPTDVASFGLATLLLLAVAAVASLLPARRAAGVDPMVALRYE